MLHSGRWRIQKNQHRVLRKMVKRWGCAASTFPQSAVSAWYFPRITVLNVTHKESIVRFFMVLRVSKSIPFRFSMRSTVRDGEWDRRKNEEGWKGGDREKSVLGCWENGRRWRSKRTKEPKRKGEEDMWRNRKKEGTKRIMRRKGKKEQVRDMEVRWGEVRWREVRWGGVGARGLT